jgi:hypothetical protein
MDIVQAYKAAYVIESIENYARSGIHDQAGRKTADEMPAEQHKNLQIYKETDFWEPVLENQEKYWGTYFSFYYTVLCEWTPRVPGLYYSKGSAAIRALAGSEVAIHSNKWVEYNPPGKSARVLGGIGTYCFPPDAHGNRLFTITFGCNASAGIPALITAEVCEALQLKEGETVHIRKAAWVKMNMDWSPRFASTKDIPNGYILINKPEQVEKHNRVGYVEFHPCSIMEYESGNKILFDYVFVCADVGEPNYRKQLVEWLEYYRTKDGRNGKYLIAPDIANPLFDAQFNSPAEMRQSLQSSGVNNILDRIRQELFNGLTLENILEVLGRHYSREEDLLGLAGRAGISPAFITRASPAYMANQLIQHCKQKNKLEELVVLLLMENPNLKPDNYGQNKT